MSALQSTSSVERYIGLLLFAETASLLSLIFRVKSHRLMKFSNVRRDRILCLIHRELSTSSRRFELSANLHRRS